MRKPNGPELKSLLILSVVVPVSLLVTLRLTGILQEPPTLETITSESVSWRLDRPSMTVEFVDERIENALNNDDASVGIGVQITAYRENSGSWPFDGRDGIELGVYVNATMKPGFAASFAVRFRPINPGAFVFVYSDDWALVSHNATVNRMKQIGTNAKEAYILATTESSASRLRTRVDWVFYDQNTEDHQSEVSLEFTYRDTSVYKKVVLRILLEMV